MESTALVHINDEIIKQKLILSDLYTQRNSYYTVSRLPPETLVTIFQHCVSDYHEYHMDGKCLSPCKSKWANFSYVCRHWRTIALDSPVLWSYIFTTSLDWMEESLVRSKHASLKICIPDAAYDNAWGLEFTEKVLNHSERVRALCLHSVDSEISPLLSKLFSCAPRLKTLKTSADEHDSDWLLMLFDGSVPPLHTLELTGCPAPRSMFRLNSLTSLNLYRLPPRFQLNMNDLLAALSGMQDLSCLYLEDALACVPRLSVRHAYNDPPLVNLPRLSQFLIAAPASTVSMLLLRMKIPLKTEVSLEFRSGSDPTSSNDIYLLPEPLAQRYSTSGDRALFGPTIHSLIIECDHSIRVIFHADEREYGSSSGGDIEWDCNIPLAISFDINFYLANTKVIDQVIDNIFWRMPLINVKTLTVNEPKFSIAFWRTLVQFQDLRYIKIIGQGYNVQTFSSFFSLPRYGRAEKRGGDSDQASCRVFAPALEELVLSGIKLPEDEGRYLVPVGVRSLCDALATRKVPRGRLVMEECMEGDVTFDMLGWWADGYFHGISRHDWDD